MICHNFQAGPGTIAEAMIRGMPIILNDYIAGQVFSLACIASIPLSKIGMHAILI
jgi:hypothetical protein